MIAVRLFSGLGPSLVKIFSASALSPRRAARYQSLRTRQYDAVSAADLSLNARERNAVSPIEGASGIACVYPGRYVESSSIAFLNPASERSSQLGMPIAEPK